MVTPSHRQRGRRYWLRLLAFFLGLLVGLPLAIVVISANATVMSYVGSAHTTIVRPSDLPATTQDVAFLGGDNLTLRGWYIPPQNNSVIILLHGYFSDRTSTVFQARYLAQAGYGVLLYDERGAGESDGSQRTFGWRDVDDVAGALAFLKDKAKTFGIFGCSVGGQIALRAAAQFPQLSAVVADGPAVLSVDDMPPAAGWQDYLPLTYDWLVDRLIEAHVGMAVPFSVMTTIGKIAPRPILLLSGALGNEKAHIQLYQQAAGSNAQMWVVPGSTHCDGPSTDPTEYASRMLNFFNKSLT